MHDLTFNYRSSGRASVPASRSPRLAFCTLAIASFAVSAVPQDISVQTILSPTEIPFHRQATLTLEVVAPADVDVQFPDLTGAVGELEVDGTPDYHSEPLEDGRVRMRETYRLDAVFPADYAIPPITVEIADASSITVPGPLLRVRDLTAEELAAAQQLDAAVPMPEFEPPVTERIAWWWVALVAALLVAVAAGLWWVMVSRRGMFAPPAPPWEQARARLRALQARDLPRTGQYGVFYVELSAILREYIEDRFAIHAPEQTTPEFLDEVRRSQVLSKEHQQRLAPFLRHADLVKFAQHQPTAHEMDESFQTVSRFVEETVPRPAEKEAEAAA